jgi:hypothetical protein
MCSFVCSPSIAGVPANATAQIWAASDLGVRWQFYPPATPNSALGFSNYDPTTNSLVVAGSPCYKTNARPVHPAVGVSRASLTKIRLMFLLATLVANSLTVWSYPLRPASVAISLFWGTLPARNSYRRMLQASILTNPVIPLPTVMITVSRLATCDLSAKSADSPRGVQSPFQLPILGRLRHLLCPA